MKAKSAFKILSVAIMFGFITATAMAAPVNMEISNPSITFAASNQSEYGLAIACARSLINENVYVGSLSSMQAKRVRLSFWNNQYHIVAGGINGLHTVYFNSADADRNYFSGEMNIYFETESTADALNGNRKSLKVTCSVPERKQSQQCGVITNFKLSDANDQAVAFSKQFVSCD